jgi:hypothetical protein
MKQQIKVEYRVLHILCQQTGGVYFLQLQILATNEFTADGDQPHQFNNSTGLSR